MARAAATKEGLTVGDWLTRRILAEGGSGSPVASPDERSSIDSEGKAEIRPLGPRLVRLENEPDATVRRVEESLRFVSKRLEVSERAQTEAQRALNVVAAGIQSANRDQAEVLARLVERMDRVERNSDTATLRDAVRGMHQGVARLTEQIAKTSSESAGQVAVLATSLEAMALKIASVRDESVRLERVIEEQLNALSDRVKQMEERVQAAPGVQQSLETRIDAAETRMREALAEHAAVVERGMEALTTRLNDIEQTRGQGHVQETIATLNRRFESSERRSKDALTTLQSGLSEAAARISRLEVPEELEGATSPSLQSTENEIAPPSLRDLRDVGFPSQAGDAPESVSPDTPAALEEYLAQTRRAAQADDPTTVSVWQIPGVAGRTCERSRMARVATQAFFLLLVMCTGFLLMQYFGPQPETGPVQVSTVTSAVPELRELAARANQGMAGAELLLGLKYADGDGVAANDTEAARWLEKAAQKGEALAQYRLGTLYEKGLGVAANPTVAADLYEKAAELGNVKAMHNLAVAYANGTGRAANYSEAARWFRAAAERGLADSQFNLAVLHERGLGVQTSLVEAYKWYAIAAAQGDNEANTRVEALMSQIPAAERDTADKAIEGFAAVPINAAVNEPPQLSQVLN